MTPNSNPSPECNCARRYDADQVEHQLACAAVSSPTPKCPACDGTKVVSQGGHDTGCDACYVSPQTLPAPGEVEEDTDTDALVKALVETEGEQTVRDMAGHIGDQVHAVLTRSGMLMKTSGGAIAVGVMAAAQVLNDMLEFARRSLDDDAETARMAAAMRVLFEQNLAPTLATVAAANDEVFARGVEAAAKWHDEQEIYAAGRQATHELAGGDATDWDDLRRTHIASAAAIRLLPQGGEK